MMSFIALVKVLLSQRVMIFLFLHRIIYCEYLEGVAQLDARLTGDQKVEGLTPAGSATCFCGDLIVKYFLQSFSPFCWFKKGSCQFVVKECGLYWFTT